MPGQIGNSRPGNSAGKKSDRKRTALGSPAKDSTTMKESKSQVPKRLPREISKPGSGPVYGVNIYQPLLERPMIYKMHDSNHSFDAVRRLHEVRSSQV